VAIEAALTKKLNKENTVVYSLHGDGELEESQIWEAAMFEANHKLDNLIATADWNGQQSFIVPAMKYYGLQLLLKEPMKQVMQ
jgi:transketolase N-terminal domain/subunit